MANNIPLEDTGERMIPAFHNRTIMFAEHMTRYIAAQELAKDKVVLDIASGSGYGTKLLAQNAQKVYGVDVSPEAIEFSKNNYNAKNIEYLLGDAEKIPVDDSTIDLLITFETIEHIKNYKNFLKEIKRVLKDDGLAIISTPNADEFTEGNHFHLHEFKYEELTALLKKTFSHIKPYNQATWTYVQISEDKFISTENAIADVKVHNFAPISREKYLYFYFLCSKREITEKITDVGALGGHYSARELSDIFAHYQKIISDYKIVYSEEQELHKKDKIKLMMREGENNAIINSSSYKLARKIAFFKHILRKTLGHIRRVNPKTSLSLHNNRKYVKVAYGSSDFTNAFKAPRTADLAVIIHLYYEDMLTYFVAKLRNLHDIEYDLYISIPDSPGSADVKRDIMGQLPNARVAIVPNCGRDVLPFIKVLKNIKNKGYTKVLKLHSKKSLHRNDGELWRDNIIDNLLPNNDQVIKRIYKLLDNTKTALIGPENEYISLLVNLSQTSRYIKMITGNVFGDKVVDKLMRHPDEYGFFAGSMFWSRFDTIYETIKHINDDNFEPELGQEDSTLAHATERLISLIPELKSMDMYGIEADKITKINYHTSNIPEWSDINNEIN